MRKPSAETENRTLRRELAQVKAGFEEQRRSLLAANMRNSVLTEEVKDWKRRFDLLLARTPEAGER